MKIKWGNRPNGKGNHLHAKSYQKYNINPASRRTTYKNGILFKDNDLGTIHLLMLMYIYSKEEDVHVTHERNTRSAIKFVFKTESKIGTKYENSPFYNGTKLWNSLNSEIQFSDNKWVFKSHISKMFKCYKSDL